MPILDYLVQNDSSTGQFFRDARLDRFSCHFGSRSEFTDNVKPLDEPISG
jgi:hypothetical protein